MTLDEANKHLDAFLAGIALDPHSPGDIVTREAIAKLQSFHLRAKELIVDFVDCVINDEWDIDMVEAASASLSKLVELEKSDGQADG
jgi:hypothetical protein